MADDMFGDSSLFEEFEKDRDSKGSFILYKLTDDGEEDKSQILFCAGDSEESDSSSDSDSEETENESAQHEGQQNIENDSLTNSVNHEANENQEAPKTDTEFKLVHERNKFERYAKIIDSTRFNPEMGSPACQIIYQNNNFSRKYRVLIEQYIMHLIDKEHHERRERLPDIPLKHSNLTCVDLNNKLRPEQRTMKMWSSHAIIGSSHFHRDFMIDPLGWPLVSNNPALTDSWEAPKYEQVYTDPLPVEEDSDSGPNQQQKQKPSCFNCGGDHMIAECTEPKDYTRIRLNRDKYRQENNQLRKQGSQRYHADAGGGPEGTSFVPGVISEELMDALGLNSNQLPSYIYKMRELGYPPGWLEEAKVQTSGLSLFDRDGNEVDLTGESMEDGEVDDTVPNKGQIDPEKIIAYPGFTVPAADNVIDEYEELGAPPLQEHQLKSTLTSQLRGLKRKMDEIEEEAKKKRIKLDEETTQEMDLSDDENTTVDNGDFVPPLPLDTPPSKPAPPDSTPPATPEALKPRRMGLPGEPPLPLNTPPSRPPLPDGTPPPTPEGTVPSRVVSASNALNRQVSAVSQSSERGNSPSLEDLEQEYQLLQQKLSEADGDGEAVLEVMDSCEGDEEPPASNVDLPQRQMSHVSSVTSITSFGDLGTGSPTSSLPGTPIVGPSSAFSDLNFTFKASTGSISKDYGTPIQKREGVADALPDPEKFGQGIMDHIPYENLPEATGTYEKMRGLIGKIRNKISFRKKKKS